MTLAKTCSCGRRVAPGHTCVCKQDADRTRLDREPWRVAYTDPSWRRARHERYMLAQGRCEACGIELRGEIYPHGVAWQGHHVNEPWKYAYPIDANTVENTMVLCTTENGRRGCHAGPRKPM